MKRPVLCLPGGAPERQPASPVHPAGAPPPAWHAATSSALRWQLQRKSGIRARWHPPVRTATAARTWDGSAYRAQRRDGDDDALEVGGTRTVVVKATAEGEHRSSEAPMAEMQQLMLTMGAWSSSPHRHHLGHAPIGNCSGSPLSRPPRGIAINDTSLQTNCCGSFRIPLSCVVDLSSSKYSVRLNEQIHVRTTSKLCFRSTLIDSGQRRTYTKPPAPPPNPAKPSSTSSETAHLTAPAIEAELDLVGGRALDLAVAPRGFASTPWCRRAYSRRAPQPPTTSHRRLLRPWPPPPAKLIVLELPFHRCIDYKLPFFRSPGKHPWLARYLSQTVRVASMPRHRLWRNPPVRFSIKLF